MSLWRIHASSGVVSLALPHIPGVSTDGSGDGWGLVGSSKRLLSDGRGKEKLSARLAGYNSCNHTIL